MPNTKQTQKPKQPQVKEDIFSPQEIAVVDSLIKLTSGNDKIWKIYWNGAHPWLELESHGNFKITKKLDKELLFGIYNSGMTPYVTHAQLNKETTRLENKITSEVTRLENKLTSEVTRLENKLTSEVTRLENKITSEVTRLENKITSEVTRLEERIIKIETRLDSHEATLNEHTKTLNEHTKTLNEHSVKLDNMSNKLDFVIELLQGKNEDKSTKQ